MSSDTSRSALRSMSGRELSDGFRAGDFNPIAVAESVLETIESRNTDLNAFTEHSPEKVLQSAKESSQRWEAGKQLSDFDGVPWTIKENIRRVGVDYRSGTAATDPDISTDNAPVVDRALESGAVIVGSTTMPDWGMLSSGVSSQNGISRSPWDNALTTGGSSAGAGAAAAAGFAVINIGTDIGGSIRLPGTWLGLATLKPSDGRVPIDPPYLGRAAGPLARSIADVAWSMKIISQPDARDYTSLPPAEINWDNLATDISKLRVGLHLEAGGGLPLDPEVRNAVSEAGKLFAAAGADVTEVRPFINDEMLRDLDLFWRVRSWQTYRELPAEKQMKVLPFIADWCMGGSDVPGSQVLKSYETIHAMRASTVAATQPYDVVLSPVATRAAYPAEWPMPFGFENGGMSHIGFTLPYNMSGQPAATVNCGFTVDGRTIGLQVSGRRFDDLGVLKAASWYESARPESYTPKYPID